MDELTRVELQGLRRLHQLRRALDPDHIERLCEVLDWCPPIIITSDGAIVDGEHRVAAALILGRTEIPAVILADPQCAGADLIRSIEANVRHGLPLTRDERRSAVEAVLGVRPDLADRAIAQICGVSRSTVKTKRAEAACSGGLNDHLNTRVGSDGKRYGAAPTTWRPHLEALLRIDPKMTVRTLAERTGASVGAVHARRQEVLARLASERRLIRSWRRLRARWWLWRVERLTPAPA
jgi:ParB-like chromosome segregation protein Spo0J